MMETNKHSSARYRLALAGVVFAIVAPLSYQAQRLYEIARFGYADARLILASVHTAFYWRVAIAVWFASACSAIAYRFTRPEAATRLRGPRVRLVVGVMVGAAAVFAASAWRFP
jgi:hypothetical protein